MGLDFIVDVCDVVVDFLSKLSWTTLVHIFDQGELLECHAVCTLWWIVHHSYCIRNGIGGVGIVGRQLTFHLT